MEVIDKFQQLWDLQCLQQKELGLDPELMNDLERRAAGNDFVLTLFEECAELQRTVGRYKRHILEEGAPDPGNVAINVVGVLKMAVAVAQLHGLDVDEVLDTFKSETQVVRYKANAARARLRSHTHVLGIDIDDCTLDLEPWRAELKALVGGAPMNAKTMALEESWKDDWYKRGRFRELKPIDGAPEGIREIKQMGVKCAFITARPQWQYKRIHADTLWSFEHYDIPHDILVFNKDKVEALYTHVQPAWPVAFVEDHERNARALSAAGVQVLLFDRPHNRNMEEIPRVTRVHGWGEVVDAVKDVIKEQTSK
jgi:phosphoglycolate phosphatase-like HAD superfamily hydrolase